MELYSHILTPKIKIYTLTEIIFNYFRYNLEALEYTVKFFFYLKITFSKLLYVKFTFFISHYKIQTKFLLFEDLSKWFPKAEVILSNIPFSSVQFSRSVMSDSLQPHEPQHARPPCPSPTPRVHPNPCPLSRWCHPTISSSVVPFSCP